MKIGWELLLSRNRLCYYSFAWFFQYYQMILLNKSIERYSPACVHMIAMFAVKSVGKSLQAFTFFLFNSCLSVPFTSIWWCSQYYFHLKHYYRNYISISYMLLFQRLVKFVDKMSDYKKKIFRIPNERKIKTRFRNVVATNIWNLRIGISGEKKINKSV